MKLGTPASQIPRLFARLAQLGDLGGLKNHNFLPRHSSSNLIGPAKGFLRLLSNFY